LSVPDSYEIIPKQFSDERGVFTEWYRADLLREVVGHALDLHQANLSVSRRGVVRGIHFADVPVGQAKYVTVAHGAVIDFIVDIRVGSPTYGQWDSVVLDTIDRRAVYISEGLGHAFVALTDEATVSYLVSDLYRPGGEHGINPLDPAIGIRFPVAAGDLVLSDKDRAAPTLAEAEAQGLLPSWGDIQSFYASQREI
jgi:dTDP-4-dehydrorhamnose 3,5-epimerase